MLMMNKVIIVSLCCYREYEFRTKFVFVNFRPRQKKEPPPHNITVSKGSIHITASRGYVDFLLNDRRAQDFTNWVKDTRNPDETLFTSLNHNPHLKVPGSFAGNYFTHGWTKILLDTEQQLWWKPP